VLLDLKDLKAHKEGQGPLDQQELQAWREKEERMGCRVQSEEMDYQA
jgi:hypothetical protein